MTREEYLAVPYVLTMEAIEGPDGDWICRASYPELPGCVSEAASPLDCLDQLEDTRVQIILERLRTGQYIPVPRPPLDYVVQLIEDQN